MSLTTSRNILSVEAILQAQQRLKGVVRHTPLEHNLHLSELYGCEVWLKREDLQGVRSYKIRGAYNKMSSLTPEERSRGIVCASAGNHAQGVAHSCFLLGIAGKIFMPATTPRQKVRKVERFGGEEVEIVLEGDTFDDAFAAARVACEREGKVFVHPFDDPLIIAGQGSIGPEILADSRGNIDFLLMPIGGGGLASGLGSYFKRLSPKTRLVGVEPEGAAAMARSLEAGQRVLLERINTFVDGAAVRQVGELNFAICRELLDEVVTVPEGQVCATILQLYNEEAIVTEPAGALAIAALAGLQEELRGKRVVCIVSGSNNDITRTEEIRERALLHQGLKHYFIIRFPQRSGALREFVVDVLGPRDDITLFEYMKRNDRETGPALVGIELEKASDFEGLLLRLEREGIDFRYVNDDPELFHLLV